MPLSCVKYGKKSKLYRIYLNDMKMNDEQRVWLIFVFWLVAVMACVSLLLWYTAGCNRCVTLAPCEYILIHKTPFRCTGVLAVRFGSTVALAVRTGPYPTHQYVVAPTSVVRGFCYIVCSEK